MTELIDRLRREYGATVETRTLVVSNPDVNSFRIKRSRSTEAASSNTSHSLSPFSAA